MIGKNDEFNRNGKELISALIKSNSIEYETKGHISSSQ
jgi:hypothetical protein